ncbi:PREDICTED: RPA-interacting protein [Atta cephalotes]|uniref:RPA-interacting protein C-terminal domain-containing protein n=2 Tax=Atta TaxID=12956 RepID=A0A158NCG5_ATTCE|nr:PREDICTED: RPA-interacting protein [Atta cephalotes]XP_018046926.1 PREDICTED: RPA-interacting protein [Atta colombica]KYM92927.1 RPA-interacting protein [Atta colombica]
MTSKLRNRDCANKIRHGSPKLQEVLREKCRQRMREKRDQLFNKRRFGLELNSRHMQDTLTEIIRQEFKNLATLDDNDKSITFKEIEEPLSQEETVELENEIVCEQEQWIIQEYEKILQDEIEYFAMYADNENREVFCPICQKAILGEENNCVNCPVCELKLTGRTMQEVRHLINESINIHAFNCVKVPLFTIIPDNSNLNLYLICHDCSTLALIC